jgi:cell division protease FtsH
LGPLSFGKKEGEIFLGREIAQNRDYSEQTAQTIDREIRDIVDKNYRRAKEIVAAKLGILHNMAQALLEYETIDGHEVNLLFSGKKIERTPPVRGKSPSSSTPAQEGGATPAPVPA